MQLCHNCLLHSDWYLSLNVQGAIWQYLSVHDNKPNGTELIHRYLWYSSLSKLAFKQQLMMMLPLIFVLCRCEGVTRFFICNSVKSSLIMPNQCIWRKTSENIYVRLKNNPLKILFGIPTVVLKPLLKFFDLVILCLISRSINNHRWGTKSTSATKMHYETRSPKTNKATPTPKTVFAEIVCFAWCSSL